MTMFLHEYRNQHAHRRYPFADAATMVSDSGAQVPADFCLDAFLYPIDLAGWIYVSEINPGTRTLTFRDSGTGAVCGTAQWTDGSDSADVFDASGFSRRVGVVVFGRGRMQAGTAQTFAPDALPLEPACCAPLNQFGVRGIVEDSGALVCGHVKFEGRGGVEVSTYVAGGKSIIRIDVVGRVPPGSPDCNDCPPIRRLVIENEGCPPVVGTHAGDGVLAITGSAGFALANLCAPKALPDDVDACDPPPAPEPWPCPPNSYSVVPAVDGRIEIVAPSSLQADNPIRVETRPEAPSASLAELAGLSLAEMQRRLRQLMRTGATGGGNIVLSLKANK